MTTPTSSFKDTGRVGADVYIRDSDDQSLQMKALVYSVNYEAQEADIGLYPRRWGKFSMLHLPAVYRVTVPLTELSLEPHAGAAQFGVGMEGIEATRAAALAAIPPDLKKVIDAKAAAVPAKMESKGKKDKPPLFTKAEILARISDVEDSLKKLRDMIDKVLE